MKCACYENSRACATIIQHYMARTPLKVLQEVLVSRHVLSPCLWLLAGFYQAVFAVEQSWVCGVWYLVFGYTTAVQVGRLGRDETLGLGFPGSSTDVVSNILCEHTYLFIDGRVSVY